MRRWLCLLLLVAPTARADSLTVLRADLRKAIFDIGVDASALAYPDSLVDYYLNASVEYGSVRSLSYTRHDTLTMHDDTTMYRLTPAADTAAYSSIMPRYAKNLKQDNIARGVPYVAPQDISLKPQRELGWALLDTLVVVTEETAKQYKLVVVYIAQPRRMVDSTGARDCQLPDVLEHAVVDRAAGMAFVASRVPALVQVGVGLMNDAKQAFDDYAQRHVLFPSDTARMPP